MSKRADLKEWTVCECHNQPIKRVNLPTHMKGFKRSAHKRTERAKKKKGLWWRVIDRLRGHGHEIDAKKLPSADDDFSDYPAYEDVIKG